MAKNGPKAGSNHHKSKEVDWLYPEEIKGGTIPLGWPPSGILRVGRNREHVGSHDDAW